MKGRVPRRKSSMDVKVFTVEEANNLLPQITESILWFQDAVRKIVETQDSLAVLHMIGAEKDDSPEHKELVEARNRLEDLVQSYNDRHEEFQKVGCLIKDIRTGLVDFYGMKDGRLVFLCWKLGEERITHWHEINAGFPGRQPLSEI